MEKIRSDSVNRQRGLVTAARYIGDGYRKSVKKS
jgi:hypothetical protein